MCRPSLSIVIPTYNGLDHLRRCLPSVREHMPPGTQVIVADDASTDGTADWIRQAHPWVELLETGKNLGFCGAVNAGLRWAQGEVVELLNNDTEVLPGWAEAALVHFGDPAVGSVAPLVRWMADPRRIDSAGMEYHLCGWAKNRGHGQMLEEGALPPRGEVFGPSGSAGFYRRAALHQTGGLLPEYGAYFEDTDLAFRLRWAGYRCLFEPASQVLHKGTATYGKYPDRLIRLISRNEELVFWINLSRRQLALGLLPHMGFQLIRLIRKLLAGQGRPFLEGKAQAFRLAPTIRRRRGEIRVLAHDARRPIELGVSASPAVVRQGLQWLAGAGKPRNQAISHGH